MKKLLVAAVCGAVAGLAVVGSGSHAAGGKVRVYYIAAEPVHWDFAPSGRNLITGETFGPLENTYVKRGPGRIGRVYWKALYRRYTDGSFTTQVPQDPYLGILGPVIHVEVGDTIRVVFLNKLPFPASIHPHGVFYSKRAEGAPYADGTRGLGDVVAPGHRYTYVWKVPAWAGPGPMDGSSVLWMYHSHVDEVRDTNTGLIGPIIVVAAEWRAPAAARKTSTASS
jgi:hypothetical protein